MDPKDELEQKLKDNKVILRGRQIDVSKITNAVLLQQILLYVVGKSKNGCWISDSGNHNEHSDNDNYSDHSEHSEYSDYSDKNHKDHDEYSDANYSDHSDYSNNGS